MSECKHEQNLKVVMAQRSKMEARVRELEQKLKEAERINKSIIAISVHKTTETKYKSVPEMQVYGLVDRIKVLEEALREIKRENCEFACWDIAKQALEGGEG